MVTIGERLKKLRNKKGLTQRQLSDKINFSHSYIGDIERNRTIPSLETLDKFARFFEVSITYFIEEGQCCFIRQRRGEVNICFGIDELCNQCPLNRGKDE